EGFWRSETPILYRKTAHVLFPVSVEAVDSVLASFALFDREMDRKDRIHNSVASENIDLIKRYWVWLKARKAGIRRDKKYFKGWHSEHVSDPSLIHLWETSKVAEFLVNFRDQLKHHVARRSLGLS